ncbi:MAG: hypothetical protein EBX40_07410, partial [Gammaproteobacteria bacterium]|nr:hypothetical protein [Gammaproteobacteria bacterium]
MGQALRDQGRIRLKISELLSRSSDFPVRGTIREALRINHCIGVTVYTIVIVGAPKLIAIKIN